MKLNLFAICQMDRLELKRVKEHDFSVAVREYAESQGWRVFYIRRTGAVGADGTWRGAGPKGWPDLVCVRTGAMVCLELKSEVGRESPEQTEWLKALASVPGIDCYVAKPRDAADLLSILGPEPKGVTG